MSSLNAPDIKVYPDLALAALRGRRSRELRLWSVLRALDPQGRAYFTVSELQRRVARVDVKGLSPSSVRRLLRSGEGIFWEIHERSDGQRIVLLRGLENVCRSFGVTRLGRPVYVPRSLYRRLRTFRGGVLAAFLTQRMHEGEWTNPISQEVLAELAGRPVRTVRGWLRAVASVVESRTNAYVARDEWTGDRVPDGYVDWVSGELVVLKRLPNSYRTDLAPAPKGMVRKVNQALSPAVDGAGNSTRRLFWQDPKAGLKAVHGLREFDVTRHQDSEVAFLLGASVKGKDAQCARGGAVLWTRNMKINGEVCCR